jgi:hypothetical protein
VRLAQDCNLGRVLRPGAAKGMLILDLCGGTGAWSQPYREAGYCVELVDPLADGQDVRLLRRIKAGVHGILAAPPCTDLSGSGCLPNIQIRQGVLLSSGITQMPPSSHPQEVCRRPRRAAGNHSILRQPERSC